MRFWMCSWTHFKGFHERILNLFMNTFSWTDWLVNWFWKNFADPPFFEHEITKSWNPERILNPFMNWFWIRSWTHFKAFHERILNLFMNTFSWTDLLINLFWKKTCHMKFPRPPFFWTRNHEILKSWTDFKSLQRVFKSVHEWVSNPFMNAF